MESIVCPDCGKAIPTNSPGGLCSACLVKLAMKVDSATTFASTTAYVRNFQAPTVAELAPYFPQLEIIEQLGQGGMGAVYKARQLHLDRVVAIKILPRESSDQPKQTEEKETEFSNRFAREARAMAKLNHPNIVNIHDYGTTHKWHYLLMEYVDGINLRQAIHAKSVLPAQALQIVMQICDAMHYAHQEMVVHRDIKPENILLDKRGRVKIADFGLAKLMGLSQIANPLTATNQVMGTVGYMAPEQLEGAKQIDHRADLYAVGVVFYELLTGELPLGRFAAPSKKVQIDVRVDEVVFKTLEKEPARRYQFASEIKDAVEQINQPTAAVRPALNTSKDWLSTNLKLPAFLLLAIGVMLLLLFFVGFSELVNSTRTGAKIRPEPWLLMIMNGACFGGGAAIVASLCLLLKRFRWLAFLSLILCLLPVVPVGFLLKPSTVQEQIRAIREEAIARGFDLNSNIVTPGEDALRRRLRELMQIPLESEILLGRWPIFVASLACIGFAAWSLMVLLHKGNDGSFSGLSFQMFSPRVLVLFLLLVAGLGCITWVHVNHISLATDFPVSMTYSAWVHPFGKVAVMLIGLTSILVLGRAIFRLPINLYESMWLVLAGIGMLVSVAAYGSQIRWNLYDIIVKEANKIAMINERSMMSHSDILQLNEYLTEGFAANCVAGIGLLIVGFWQLSRVLKTTPGEEGMYQAAGTSEAMLIQSVLSILLFSFGSGLVCWFFTSFIYNEPTRMLFGGYSEYAWVYLVLGMLLMSMGMYLYFYSWKKISAKTLHTGGRITLFCCLFFSLMFGIVMLFLADSPSAKWRDKLAPFIVYYSEIVGWCTGILTMSLASLLMWIRSMRKGK